MTNSKRPGRWLRRLAVGLALLTLGAVGGSLLLSRADGPLWVFAGGPLRSGELVELSELDWERLDAASEFELEIVGLESSRTLWFSVHEGAVYVACDLDCIDGRLTRWPQAIERDGRVVVRIAGKRAAGRLVHVPHGTPEYAAARAVRERKYAGDDGARAAAESAAHGAVVGVGESLTGRDQREEPGDRLYRLAPRPAEASARSATSSG